MTDFAFGRRAPKDAPALRFASFRDALVIPEHPGNFNSIDTLRDWDILGNDRIGDCVAVTWATVRRIVTEMEDDSDSYPGLDQVLALYKTQNPDFDPNGTADTNGPGSTADGGMVIQTVLEHLVNEGGPDGVKALAFAKVDHTNVEEVRAAIAVFGYLWLGVNVTDANMRQFPNTPWTPEGRILGGHSVTGTGYDVLRFVMETWAEQSYLANNYFTTGSNSTAGVEEAWIVVWPEHATKMGTDARAALDGAFYGMTGRHIAWPDAPAPEPVPEPPADPQAEFVAAARDWLAHRRTRPVNVAFAKAVEKYLDSL